MKLNSLIVAGFVLVQVAAFTACQTAAVRENGSRGIASVVPTGLTAAFETLARGSTLDRVALTSIIETEVLRGAKIASVVGTGAEFGAVSSLIKALGNNAIVERLKLKEGSKTKILAELNANVTAMKAAAGAGTDTGTVAATGFGIPVDKTGLTRKNASLGAARNPANKATLWNIVKIEENLEKVYGGKIVGDLNCVANGDLSDPEALKNFETTLAGMTQETTQDPEEAFVKSEMKVIGKDTHCALAGAPCDALNNEKMGKTCKN